MSVIVILGAGPLGAATADALARRDRVREIALVDGNAAVAEGKALDLLQAGPIAARAARVTAAADVTAAARADVVVVADRVDGGEWRGDDGLAMVRRLVRAGVSAPIVFAGPEQVDLLTRSVLELGVPADRAIATAGAALVGAVRAFVAVEVDGSGADVQVSLAGRPAAPVIAWSAATIGGSLVSERVPAHRLIAIGAAVTRLWPPGPQAIAAATARVVEGLVFGARRHEHAATIIDGEFGLRRVAALLPLELGRGRVRRRLMPTLSPVERTAVVSALTEG